MSVRLPAVIVVAALLSSCAGPSPAEFSEAVASGELTEVSAMLDDGADANEVDGNGFTALMSAANRDDPDMVRLLVEGGAEADMAGMSGLTALHVAAAADAKEAAGVLLELGADPHVRSDSGMNALDQAAAAGALATLRLLAGRVDLDAPSEVVVQGHGTPRDVGPTPLAIAVRAGRSDAVALLVELGADVDGVSTAGHTPLLTAVFSDQAPGIVEILLEAGADPTVSVECDRGCSVSGAALDAPAWAKELGREGMLALLDASP